MVKQTIGIPIIKTLGQLAFSVPPVEKFHIFTMKEIGKGELEIVHYIPNAEYNATVLVTTDQKLKYCNEPVCAIVDSDCVYVSLLNELSCI
ncbi:MAG: hypothetical protein LKE87_12425 [Solobacterium sp.]|jgi:hypothetical protein|nr:hypothetical protein [Solobacterium sp.]